VQRQKQWRGIAWQNMTADELRLMEEAFDNGVRQRSALAARTAAPLPPREVNVLDPENARTAGRGGIDRITESKLDDGAIQVEMEGRLIEPPGRRSTWAPNYNNEPVWRKWRDWFGFRDWQAAHLWGPGFGDEAAAGIMLAPSEVNQYWQNRAIETILRDLRDTASMTGQEVRLVARATSHPPNAGGLRTLKDVSYEFTLVGPNGATEVAGQVSFSVEPGGRVCDRIVRWMDVLTGRPPG
jgi:hypothetical protein